jgi:hypothetical protein
MLHSRIAALPDKRLQQFRSRKGCIAYRCTRIAFVPTLSKEVEFISRWRLYRHLRHYLKYIPQMIFQEIIEGKAREYTAYITLTALFISMNFILSGKPLQKPTILIHQY